MVTITTNEAALLLSRSPSQVSRLAVRYGLGEKAQLPSGKWGYRFNDADVERLRQAVEEHRADTWVQVVNRGLATGAPVIVPGGGEHWKVRQGLYRAAYRRRVHVSLQYDRDRDQFEVRVSR